LAKVGAFVDGALQKVSSRSIVDDELAF